MKEQLYRVTNQRFCGGFVVQNGIVVKAAPFLHKRIIGLTCQAAIKTIMQNPFTNIEKILEICHNEQRGTKSP